MNEIEIASKLSTIKENLSKDNIVNSGRVQGINIYKDKVNILIAKKKKKQIYKLMKSKKILVQYLITKIIYRLT